MPFILVDGLSKIADDNRELWNDSIDLPWNITEKITTLNTNPHTGFGTPYGDPNNTRPGFGSTTSTDGSWYATFGGENTIKRQFYVVSDPLTVMSEGPDLDDPEIASTTPGDGTSNFPITRDLVATFDENIPPALGILPLKT